MKQEMTTNKQERTRSGKRLQSSRNARNASSLKAAVQSAKQSVSRAAATVSKPEARTEKPKTPQSSSAGRAIRKWWEFLCTKFTWMRRRWERIICEVRRHNFPESDRRLIQLVLFLWNLIPMVASLLREKLSFRRRQALRKAATGLAHVEHHRRLRPVAFMMSGCALLALMLVISMYTVGTTVTYDGEVIAVVASEEEAEAARNHLETVTTKTLGHTFELDDSLLQYSTGLMKRQDVVDDQTSLENDLTEELGLVTNAFCLYVGGERIGATPYPGALEELLEQLKEAATDENTISCEFAEEVYIRQEMVPTEEIVNLGHIAETLYSTKTAEVTYEVKKGDTWSEIAQDHGLSSKELLALNPGYDINKLQIGEILTMSASVPYLTMTVVQQERYVDQVQFPIEYSDSADMYQGDYKITSKGEYGAADVVASVTYVNGQEIDRTVLSSVTLKDPVTEQRLQGTKPRPTWYPTGSFRWPTSGRITSYFGGRKSPGGIGSTNHKGLDIAAPKGTAIYAADGGTVVSAGWQGGYGYTVRIRHDGTGFETLYAHNSRLLVSAGQHVYKGQQIAKMGSTGNSTGSHCHFEIRLNGVAKNPLNYI